VFEGFTAGIPDTLMGLTVIAAGTSVPQVVGSVIVARKGTNNHDMQCKKSQPDYISLAGLGTMAMNNAIGSNIFNVLICMGMPWLIRIVMDKGSIPVQSNSLIYSILMLIISTIFLYAMLAFNGFNFDRKIGVILFIAYLIFIVVGSLFELNVFLDINLPACPV
jgi:Ca2+/Na+ antiporter